MHTQFEIESFTPFFVDFDSSIFLIEPNADIYEIDPVRVTIYSQGNYETRGTDLVALDIPSETGESLCRIFWRGEFDERYGDDSFDRFVELLDIFGARHGPPDNVYIEEVFDASYQNYLSETQERLARPPGERWSLVGLSPFLELHEQLVSEGVIQGWLQSVDLMPEVISVYLDDPTTNPEQ